MSVGQIIGGIVGAVIGFWAGGPYGAVQGFAIGASIGGVLMPGSLPTIEGPRLGDLHVQSSEYGRAIPIVYGTVGLQGNVIWASDLVEVTTYTEQGGKGGPSQTTSSSAYFGNFAVVVCDGPVSEVLRIWAGPEKRLIYDGFALEGGTVRIYKGTDSQMPDPLIETYKGAGNVPAYRGSCYVVFEMFPLANDGNRLPFLTFEVSTAAKVCGDNFTEIPSDLPYPVKLYDPAPIKLNTIDGTVTGRPAQDPQTGMIYYLRNTGTGPGTQWIDKVDPITRTLVDSLNIGDSNLYGAMALNETERVIQVVLWDQLTVIDLETFTIASQGTMPYVKSDIICVDDTFYYLNFAHETTDGEPDPDNWGRIGAFFGGYFVDCDGWLVVVSLTQPATLTDPLSRVSELIGVTDHIVEWDFFDPVARRLVKLVSTYNGGLPEYYNVDTGEHITCSTPFSGGVVNCAVYNKYIGRVLCNNGAGMLMVDPSKITPTGIPVECIVFTGVMAYSEDATDTVNYHYSLLPVTLHTDPRHMAFIDRIQSGLGGDNFLFTVRQLAAGAPLWEIVADLNERAGQTSYDVSELQDIVPGYAIAKQTNARACIDALRPAYYFDAVESQGVVKYVKRGHDVVVSIPYEDLAADVVGSDMTEPLSTTRAQEIDMPRVVNVAYLQAATDYSSATKTAKRLVGSSIDEHTFELPLVLTDEKAQEIADVNLHSAWANRLSYSFNLPRKYARLEPTDMILVRGLPMRLNKVVYTPQGIIKCNATSDDAQYYAPHSVVTETLPSTKTVSVPGPTTLELM